MSSLIGSNIGPYSVLSCVGSGGMGTVYRGVHTQLGRPVALKVLHSQSQTTDRVQANRLLGQARLQASLRHPGVATLYDFLEYNGQGCIVMEFVEGPTLAEYLTSHVPLPTIQALRILGHIADAVQYLHTQGIIHRDLKPANVKLCTDDTVKLLDFGIAQAFRTQPYSQGRVVEGTFEYTAPECLLGQPADQRSDIWSLGVLLYEMVMGHLPFAGASIKELSRQIEAGFKPPTAVNKSLGRGVENLLARCLRKKPSERFSTIAELQLELKKQLQADSRVPAWDPKVNWGRKSWIRLSIVAAACLALGMLWHFAGSRPIVATPAASDEKTITIETVNGSAEVFRNGKDLGSTPLRVDGHSGERVSLLLKRDGFADLPVEFDVDERSSYSYVLYEDSH